MRDSREGDAAHLRAHVAGRFGNGSVARTAAERALAARPGIFQTNNVIPSPLLGQRDPLVEQAAAVLGSSQNLQDGYPYRYPSPPSPNSHPQAAIAYPPASPPQPTYPASSPLDGQGPQPRPTSGIPAQYRGAVQAAQQALRQGSPQPPRDARPIQGQEPARSPAHVQQPAGHRAEAIVASPGSSRTSSPGQQRTPSLTARIQGPSPTGRPRSPSPAAGPSRVAWQKKAPAWAAQAAAQASPTTRSPGGSPQPAVLPGQASPAAASPARQPVSPVARRRSPRSVSPSGRVAGWNRQGGYTSHVDVRLESSENIRHMLHQQGDEFYRRYQVKQHREDHPDYAFTQRPARRMITLAQQNIGFEDAHPALAQQHYLRSPEQDLELAEERRRLAALKQRRAHKDQARRASESPRATHSGTDQENEDVKAYKRDVQQRAADAIHTSKHITAKYRARSASPGRGSRSPLSRHSPRMTSRDDMSADYQPPESYPEWMSDQEPMRAPRYPAPAVHRKSWNTGGDNSDSLADHVAHDTGERPAEPPVSSAGPALTPDEFKLAAGVFSEDKYEEYNRQMDHEMELRAQQRGYDSDEERAEKAAAAAAVEALTDDQKAILAKQQEEARQLEALLHQSWQEQNSWMDYYRERLGPQEGYNTPSRSVGGQSHGSTPQQPVPMLVDMMSPGSSGGLPYYQGSPGPMSPSDHQLADAAFVPLVSPDLHADGYLYPRQRNYASDGGTGGGRRGAAARQSFTPTKPKPFTFEERAANRPKTIMNVKLQQDLAIRKQEEQAAKNRKYIPKPVPRSNSPGLYEQQMLMAEVRRQINKDSRLEQLAGLVEKPFSFQERDEQRAKEAAALAEAAKHPDRFQIPFYAKPIPDSVKTEKFKYMMLELESKRLGARERMEQARAKARQRVEADVAQRQTKADSMYKERLRVVDPVWNQKYETQSAGAIPDFNLLHSQWEQRLAKLRALTRHNITVPNEFGTHNARDAQEKAARERKALERRQRILMDIALDSELLPENRWPYKTPRGRVRPAPPPVNADPDFKVSDTRANILRRAATQAARKAGQYADPYERERRALLKARKEASIRAAAYTKMKDGMKKGGVDTGPIHLDTKSQGGAGVRERREALKDATVPVMHLEARHAQAEKQARMEIEDVLLQTGVYNDLRYNEDKPKKTACLPF